MRLHLLLASSTLAPLAAGLPASDLPASLPPSLELRAGDAEADDGFGFAVAMGGDLAVVGAPGNDELGANRGAAYLFDLASGNELRKLLPADLAGWTGQFGASVAIDGGLVVVGAPMGATESGAAYVFQASTGAQVAKLLPATPLPSQRFGISVALSGTTALVGAFADDADGNGAGAAFVFDALTGTQLARLRPDDAAPLKAFGVDLWVDGTTAIIGAPGDDGGLWLAGAAYLFDLTTGLQLAKLVPDDHHPHMDVGNRVRLSGGLALVSAPGDDHFGFDSGAAYLFDAASGAQLQKLLASDGAVEDFFGGGLALSGSTVVIGAPGNDDAAGSGDAFDAHSGAVLTRVAPPGLNEDDRFGGSMAIQGASVLAGAPGADGSRGVAWLFERPLGSSYCVATPNSASPTGARMWAVGSASLAAARLLLLAEGVPDQPALFFYGPSPVQLPFGDGFRCVGGPVRRLPLTVASGGSFTTEVDFDVHGADLAGLGTAYFQGWFRDPAAAGAGFNLTDARELELTP